MKKIRTGDEVVVITGRSKGIRGKVLRFVDGLKVLVEGVQKVSKHVKPNPSTNQPGGVVQKESPIHYSNIQLFNPKTGKADKVGIRALEDGSRVRYFKSTGEVVDV